MTAPLIIPDDALQAALDAFETAATVRDGIHAALAAAGPSLQSANTKPVFDLNMRIVELFDKDETASSFLNEDGEGGFLSCIFRMAREIERLRKEPSVARDRALEEALIRIARISRNDGPWDQIAHDMQQIASRALSSKTSMHVRAVKALKPCPFCNGHAEIVEDSGSFFARCENSACPPAPQTPSVDDADTAANDWNTRPAVPVEGLESYEYGFPSMQKVERGGDWCTRSQAEAIIAAKDAELAAVMQAIADPENQPSQFGTVTVEYMERQIADMKEARDRYRRLLDLEASDHDRETERLKTIKAQLTTTKEALKFYADVHKYPAPLTGGMGELWSDCGAIARAALGVE